MKEKVLAALTKCGPMRRRAIAMEVHCWVASPQLTAALYSLSAEGKIVAHEYSDPANAEWYNIWEVI